MNNSADAQQTPRDYFIEGSRAFGKTTQSAVKISESRIGVFHTGRQNRVLFLFAKAITHALSIELIQSNATALRPEVGLLDHFSIGALTRTLIDSCIMTLYLSEPSLSVAEWDLRRHVLFLHDLMNRRRFLSAMRKHAKQSAPPNDESDFKQARKNIASVIRQRATKLALPENQIQELLKGQIVFLDGVRGAIREAKLDVNHFDFMHTYLSNQVHSHPVSYLRAEEQMISFETPSDFQFGFCGFCLEAGAQYLDAVTARVESFTGNAKRDPNGQIN